MRRFVRGAVQWVDVISWLLTALFFCGAAFIYDGDMLASLGGALAVVFIMFVVGLSIEVIIETMKNVPGIGTVTGFLTNGPEALVVIVGLVTGDILFAASTPLGSNYMNPLLLIIAALLTGRIVLTMKAAPLYFSLTMLTTIVLAGGFYLVDAAHYWLWVVSLIPATAIMFLKRPPEKIEEEEAELAVSKLWMWPSIVVLVVAGYCLDPVVGFASEASLVPKGVIGFVVLSILTSWPEFKSCLALLRRDMALAAILNIAVSNITNLWLAGGGVVVYLLM